MDQGGGDVGRRIILRQQTVEQLVVAFVFALLQGLAQRFGEGGGAFAFDFFGRRNSLAPDAAVGEALDVFEPVNLAAGDEGDGLAALARAAGAADAMDVIFAVVRQVVIEDDLDVVDVEPARGDIGRDEESRLRACGISPSRARASPGSCRHAVCRRCSRAR